MPHHGDPTTGDVTKVEHIHAWPRQWAARFHTRQHPTSTGWFVRPARTPSPPSNDQWPAFFPRHQGVFVLYAGPALALRGRP